MQTFPISTQVLAIVGPFHDSAFAAVTNVALASEDSAILIKPDGTSVSITSYTWAHIAGGYYKLTIANTVMTAAGNYRIACHRAATHVPVWEDLLIVSTDWNGVLAGTENAAKDTDIPAPPAASAIADAVWDETISGHIVAGSAGESLILAAGCLALLGDPANDTLALDIQQLLINIGASMDHGSVKDICLVTQANSAGLPDFISDTGTALGNIPGLVWDVLRAAHTLAGSFGAAMQARSLVLGPITAQLVPANRVGTGTLHQIFLEEEKELIIVPLDANSDPIDLTSLPLRYVVTDAAGVTQFISEAIIVNSPTTGCTVTIADTLATAPVKGRQWLLWDTSVPVVLAHGPFEVLPAAVDEEEE